MILPLVTGVRLYLYPSPLHYKIIPQAVAKTKATILFGTDTFLAGYARTAKDSDFASRCASSLPERRRCATTPTKLGAIASTRSCWKASA